MSLSHKGLGYLATGGIVLTLGMAVSSVVLIVLGMFFLIFLALSSLKMVAGLEVNRHTMPVKVYEGDLFTMKLQLRSERSGTVVIRDGLPGFTHLVRNSNVKWLPIFPDSERTVSYTIAAPLRGYFTLGPLEIEASDPFRLFIDSAQIDNLYALTVLPEFPKLDEARLFSRARDLHRGDKFLPKVGSSSEFHAIRDYNFSDPFNTINWRATARLGHLMVNSYEKETLSDALVMVDSRAATAAGSPLLNHHEISIKLAFGIASYLIENRDRVTLVTYNDYVNIVPAGVSRKHSEVIQHVLLETRSQGNWTFEACLHHVLPYLKPHAVVVLLSPLVADVTIETGLLRLIQGEHLVVLVTGSAGMIEAVASRKMSSRHLLMQIEWENQLERFQELGVRCVDWTISEPRSRVLTRVASALGQRVGAYQR